MDGIKGGKNFMLNIIKMDLYKMFKMRSFYVVNIIAIAFGVIMAMNIMPTSVETSTSESVAIENADKNSSSSNTKDEPDANIGIQVDTSGLKDVTQNAVFVYGKLLSSGIYVLFSVIFVMIFVSSENKNGYIKNIGGQVKHRRQLFVSKMITIGIYTVLFDALMFLTEIIICMICVKKFSLGVGSFNGYISFIIFQVLLQYTFMIVCATIEVVTKSRVFGMTAAVCLSIGMGTIICMAVDVGVKRITGLEIALEKYLITTKINSITPGISMTQQTKLVVFIVIYLAVAAAVGMISMEKRDLV